MGRIIRRGERVLKTGGSALKKGEKAIQKGIMSGGSAINKKRLEYQKKLAKNTGLILVIIMIIVFTIVIINYKHFEDEATFFAQTYGVIGIFVVAFAADMVMQPIGPDVPLIGGILGGINPYYAFLAAVSGSIVASLTGYILGNFYGEFGIKMLYSEKKYEKWKKLYAKWGRLSLAVAAISPVPYVPFCWISGIFKLSLLNFIIFAFIPRITRFILVMYLSTAIIF